MAQKSHFKALKTGTYIKRHTFPQLPFAELDKPKTFKTQAGDLLVDGLWAYLRKPSASHALAAARTCLVLVYRDVCLHAVVTHAMLPPRADYIADWIQALIWGASAGTHSLIPYYYPVFHCTMLLHRNSRDDAKCARKYGDDWKRYKELVPCSCVRLLFLLPQTTRGRRLTLV